MTDRGPERLAAAVAVLVAAAGAVLALGPGRGGGADPRAGEFRRLAGGLDPGSAATLAACEAAHDGGIAGTCSRGLDPVPGGFAFCPHHAGPSLRR